MITGAKANKYISLTTEEWMNAIQFLTRVGQTCTPLRQEFILLSEGNSSTTARLRDPAAGSDGEEEVIGSEEFNAMMITWTGGIAERAGLGRLFKPALWSCCKREMKWKEILLG